MFTSQWLRYRSQADYFIDLENTDTLKEPFYSSRSLGRDDHVTVSILEQELAGILGPQNMFLYINFAGTHFPYRVGPGYHRWQPARDHGFHPKKIDLTINQYNNAMLYFDAAFGRVINQLKESGLYENSVVILASDHGEAMMEHDLWGHGPVFYQEGIEAPIYIHIGEKVRDQFSQQELAALEKNQSIYVNNVDVFATVLDIIGVTTDRKISGRSLLAEYPLTVAVNTRDRKNFAAINSHTGIKLIVSNTERTVSCFNLRNDNEEKSGRHYTFPKRLKISESKVLLLGMEDCTLPSNPFTPVDK